MYATLSLLACLAAAPLVCATSLPGHVAGVLWGSPAPLACTAPGHAGPTPCRRLAQDDALPPVRAVIAGARL